MTYYRVQRRTREKVRDEFGPWEWSDDHGDEFGKGFATVEAARGWLDVAADDARGIGYRHDGIIEFRIVVISLTVVETAKVSDHLKLRDRRLTGRRT